MVTQPPAAAPPTQPPAAAAAVAAPQPILFQSNKADTPWQHEYVSGTTIGANIRMEAHKVFIPKPWQPPMTNMTIKMVNNFLGRIRSKCKDLAIYCTEIIQIVTADGDQHNLLVNYNDIKLSNMCHTVCTLHRIKDDNTELGRD
jgi:Pyruvate/2-oxoacid:ferredoxin oxidoreductase delta subunit